MVGVGVDGQESMLARVCIINSYGNVVYDKFVKPRCAASFWCLRVPFSDWGGGGKRERVVDYRTWVSGVTKAHLEGDDGVFSIVGETFVPSFCSALCVCLPFCLSVSN